MSLLTQLGRERIKLRKEIDTVQQRLKGVEAAIVALNGGKTKRRKMSAAARARKSKAQKARWAKVRSAK